MNEFTVFYFERDLYHKNKIKLKKMMIALGNLKWNATKHSELDVEQTVNAFTIFGYKDKIKSELLKGRTSSSGVWESKDEAVKAIMMSKKNEDEHIDLMLIYKGSGDTLFYKEFLKYCVDVGAWVSKVQMTKEGFEEIFFRRRKNIELVDRLDSVEGRKEVMKEMFVSSINSLRSVGDNFSEKFIEGWKKCIEKYGGYTREDLYNEIEKKGSKPKEEKEENIMIEKIEKINEVKNDVEAKVSPVITGKKYVIRRKLYT